MIQQIKSSLKRDKRSSLFSIRWKNFSGTNTQAYLFYPQTNTQTYLVLPGKNNLAYLV